MILCVIYISKHDSKTFWHDHGVDIRHSEMTVNCRAALWYSDHVTVTDSKLHGIKAFRECGDVTIRNCDIISPEFGWSVQGICMEDTTAVSEYFMMRSGTEKTLQSERVLRLWRKI